MFHYCGHALLTRPHTSGVGMQWYNGRSWIPVSFAEMKSVILHRNPAHSVLLLYEFIDFCV